MDVKFTNTVCSSLRPVLQEVTSCEQTQEIRLSDSMPDVGRVICAWGQCILRSKEWNLNNIQCAAGMMVWILYAPEDGSEPRLVNSWIPIPLRWELPDNTPDGHMIVQCLSRFADARSVSPRKILVRCGMSAQIQAYIPEKTAVSNADDQNTDVALLHKRFPLRLRKEVGEKAFALDEELSLPDSAPRLEKLLYCTLEPGVQEARVLADKLVFRGNMKLHILYASEEGQLHSWDFPLPFSQYALLDGSYGSDVQCELTFCVTGLESEAGESGVLRIKSGVVCQYLITDREMMEVVEDAYSLRHELELTREKPEIQVLLDRQRETLRPEHTVNVDANIVPDVQFLPDFPRIRREGDFAALQWPGMFQILYYSQDGALHSATARWEGEQKLPLDNSAALTATPAVPEAQVSIGNGSIKVSAELPVELEASADQSISVVTGIRSGQQIKPDPSRPSVILQRAGMESLWEMAKKYGSTVEAICMANGIQEEPVDRRMLLIPVL